MITSEQDARTTLAIKVIMSDRYPYPDEATRKRCLTRLRQTNHQLKQYNLFLKEAIAQIEAELNQQKQSVG